MAALQRVASSLSLSASSYGSCKGAGADVMFSDQFPAGLRVLVVDDDITCLRLLEKMLCRCLYNVTTCSQATAALKLLRERKGCFDVVLSDVHMPDMDGFKLLELVGLEMDLPVIMMSADGRTSAVMRGISHGACDYLIKPIREEELKNIWQHVIRKKWNENKEQEHSGSFEDNDWYKRGSDDTENASSVNEGAEGVLKGQKKRNIAKEEDDNELEIDDPSASKKPRVVWSVELHQQFVSAVNQLGIDKAVPKRILELMNVPGLTRENVASHLQKFRLYLKRLSGVAQQGGISNTFCAPLDSNVKVNPLGRFDIQALAASSQIPPQTLAALHAELFGRPTGSLVTTVDQPALLQASMQGPKCIPVEHAVAFGQPLVKCQSNISKHFPRNVISVEDVASGFGAWSSNSVGTVGSSSNLGGMNSQNSNMLMDILQQQPPQQSSLSEPSRSINVQPSCLVVPSQSPATFQAGNSPASVDQNCSYNRSAMIDYNLLSAQSNNSSLNIGQILNGDLKTTGVSGYSGSVSISPLSPCSVDPDNTSQQGRSSTMAIRAVRQLPGLGPNISNFQGSYSAKSSEVLDQRPLRNLGFVAKCTSIPSRLAVDEFESSMSSLDHEKSYMEISGNKVKQEPNIEFMDNARVGIPILQQLPPAPSDRLAILSNPNSLQRIVEPPQYLWLLQISHFVKFHWLAGDEAVDARTRGAAGLHRIFRNSGGAWAPPTSPAALGLTPSGSEAPFLPRYSSADGRRWSCWWSEKWKMKLMLVVEAVTGGAVLAAEVLRKQKETREGRGLCCFLSTGTLFHILFALFSLRGKYYYTKALKFEPVLSWSQFEAEADSLSLMDKTQQEVALTQLRKSVQKLGSSTDKYGDPTLMRFLISRSMDPAKAAKLFVEWQKWRASFVPDGSIPDSEVEDELGPRKAFHQSPVVLQEIFSDLKISFKFVVHLLDKTIASSFKGREIGNEKLIAILDLQHMSYKNIDARGMITAFQLLQVISEYRLLQKLLFRKAQSGGSYYPERLAKCFILSMPWFYVSCWRMISRFLEKGTLEKIVIVNNDEERKCFVKEIGEEVLPEELGGRATLVALQDRNYTIEELTEDSFDGVDIALFSAGGSISKHFGPVAMEKGSVVVDNSSAFRMEEGIPLVIPEVNPEAMEGIKVGTGKGALIANPNCSTIICLMATPLHKHAKVIRMVVSTYQAASGAGAAAMEELELQTREYAFNLFSHNAPILSNGYNEEELKLVKETRKIWNDMNVKVTATCIRVPVMRAHAESVNLQFEKPIDEYTAKDILKSAPGVVVIDDRASNHFPTPLEVSNKDDVAVGRIRRDVSQDGYKGLDIFVCGDQIRKGAALNAIQIAEMLL
ncbi:hypothetical protein NC651_024398 [Populus alba x Populus x berolinensis]|nr:hypothetical protein NC651_024398 [Populus alba x Populus x berolinensis]